MVCPRCKADTRKLIIADGPLGCPACISVSSDRNPNLHQNANSTCKMTYAERMKITSRTPDSQGNWSSAKKWRDSYD